MTDERIDMADYSTAYADQYARGTFETQLVTIRRRWVAEALSRYAHRRVLEIGCGLEPLFDHVTGWDEFVVVEPSAPFVARARELSAGREGIRIVHGFFGDEHAELAQFRPDFIAVSSLLHEVPDPHALLSAVHNAMADDTVTHFNVPNMRSFHRLLAVEMGLMRDVFEPSDMERRFQRRTRYDLASLRAIVEGAGFRVVRSGTYFVKPFTHAQMQAMMAGGIIDQRVLDGLDAMTRHLPDMGAEAFVDVMRR
jgi:SAM-dependent methyltransferase